MPDPVSAILLSGSKPKVPEFVPLDAQASQVKAVQGNIAAFDDISALATETNLFNQEELNRMLSTIPGWDAMATKGPEIIQSWMRGEIPQDVQQQIQSNAAFKSLTGGFSGSGMQGNLLGRDLGLTSMQLQAQGLDAGSRWMQMARQTSVAPMFDVTAMFVTPQQQMAVDQANLQGRFQRDWLNNKMVASPEPWMTNLYAGLSQIWDTALSVGAMYAGGGMGGAGGMMGGMGGGGGGGGNNPGSTFTAASAMDNSGGNNPYGL